MVGKTDGLRQVAKRGYWREADARVLIESWRSSGEPLARFAKRYGVERKRLARWLTRLQEAAPEPLTLHPVRLMGRPGAGSSGGTGIEIELAEGLRVRVPHGFAVEDLRRVLAVLAESTPC